MTDNRRVLRQNGEEFIPYTEIADDLVTTDEGVSLSANQGVVINGRLVKMESEWDEYKERVDFLSSKTDTLDLTKENKSNKVHQWPLEITSDLYPSAVLVKSELDIREMQANKQQTIQDFGEKTNEYYASIKAIMNFVNSSIQTLTASFKGAWGTWAMVPTAEEQWLSPPQKNDYIVVLADENHGGETWRYKYDPDTPYNGYDKNKWKPEYKVNDTAFTQAQLDAINSGITADLVVKLNQLFVQVSNLATRISALENSTLTSRDPTTNTGNGKKRR